MHISMHQRIHSNADTEDCSSGTPLSLFMSNLLSKYSKIEIVDDNPKKRAYDCKIMRQYSLLSIRPNQRWDGGSAAESITAPSRSSSCNNTNMTIIPQRRKSLESMESSSSEFSCDSLDDDDDFDDICSNVSLETFTSSYCSCDLSGSKDHPLSRVTNYNMHSIDNAAIRDR